MNSGWSMLTMLLAGVGAFGQWPSSHTPGIPRTADGKPDLSAKAPRTPDGKPDFSGLWAINTQDYWYDIGIDAKPGGVPMQPWAETLYRDRNDNLGKDNPIARCMPASVPTIDAIPLPFKVIQTSTMLAMLYEYNMQYRQVFLDGRALPKDPNPAFMGYSTAKWDNDTLVVETGGLKDNT
jgi:hypothetical protein